PPPIPPILEPKATRPVISEPVQPRLAPLSPIRPAPSPINWESFLGVKLFAWLGGLALFLGVAFFVKFSFEHNWITPQMRVTIGYLFGAGLITGGLFLPRARHAVTVQTLCAT